MENQMTINVVLCLQRLIVCLEESLHIHNIRDTKILHTIRDTPPNLHGLCALSPCVDHCYVAYHGSSTVGEVQIFDAAQLVYARRWHVRPYDSNSQMKEQLKEGNVSTEQFSHAELIIQQAVAHATALNAARETDVGNAPMLYIGEQIINDDDSFYEDME
ncbi:unnamed protein product [Euphydryas editha]|uniref:Uncharacterized protein n=1 Tax=Euphydryas editha TaxID=104508 RepID=A0AAU9USQ7_EUPED|nr:unnamed protein product [Euphydryas editha]